MGLVDPGSEVTATADGWVWLRAEPRSLQHRQTLAWTLVALALGAGAAGVAFLPTPPGVLVAAVCLVAAVTLVRQASRTAHTRAGACAVGVLLQMGPRVVQAGWAAVSEVRAAGADRGRARLVVATDQGPTHATGATFDTTALASWLAQAAEAARTAGRRVEPLDGGPDFAVR